MQQRWEGHLNAARTGKTFALSRAIRKHGEDAWDHVELEIHEDHASTIEAEIFFIAYLQTMIPNGYNMTRGGNGASGELLRRLTKEAMWRPDVRARHLAAQSNPDTKRRHAEATRQTWKDPQIRANHRAGWEASITVIRYGVEQLDPKTFDVIARFKSLREACRVTGVARSTLQGHLKGNLRHAGGFCWQRVNVSIT
jgi:hypothetical protein